MVIQCDQCQARFRLEDEKLQRGPVKVRCSKCKHVFLVSGQVSADAVPGDEAGVGGGPAEGAFRPTAASAAPSSVGEKAEPEWSNLFAGSAAETSVEPPVEQEAGSGGFDFNEFDFSEGAAGAGVATAASEQQAPTPPAEDRFELGEFGDLEPSAVTAAVPPDDKALTDAPDFGDLTFGDAAAASAAMAAESAADTADFSFDFGDLGLSDDTVGSGASAGQPLQGGAPTDEMSGGSFSFDLEPAVSESPAPSGAAMDFSFDMDNLAPAAPSQETRAGAGEAGGLDFGEIDFGDLVHAPAAPSQPAAAKPVVALGEEAVLAGDHAPEAAVRPFAPEAEAGEELPPLAIPSRRKGGSLFPALVVATAIVVIVALAGFGFYVLSGPEAFTKVGLGFVADMAGLKVQEEGVIAIRNVTGTFVQNKEAGELLVLRGEAVNNFKKPRASIQVKGSLYDKAGNPLVTRTAYCGNDVAKEQLAVLPMAKIDEAMNNQFGDSLANLGVQPGKAIPFVVVFSAVPKEAADFAVHVTGSTVATQ